MKAGNNHEKYITKEPKVVSSPILPSAKIPLLRLEITLLRGGANASRKKEKKAGFWLVSVKELNEVFDPK